VLATIGMAEWVALTVAVGQAAQQARSLHWFPYDRVCVVNADP
jgi:hypothetical protein